MRLSSFPVEDYSNHSYHCLVPSNESWKKLIFTKTEVRDIGLHYSTTFKFSKHIAIQIFGFYKPVGVEFITVRLREVLMGFCVTHTGSETEYDGFYYCMREYYIVAT